MDMITLVIAIVAIIISLIAIILVLVKQGPQGDKGNTGNTGTQGPIGETFTYKLIQENDTGISVSDGYIAIFDNNSPISATIITDETANIFMFAIINENMENQIMIEGSQHIDTNGTCSISLPPNSISWVIAEKTTCGDFTTRFFTSQNS